MVSMADLMQLLLCDESLFLALISSPSQYLKRHSCVTPDEAHSAA